MPLQELARGIKPKGQATLEFGSGASLEFVASPPREGDNAFVINLRSGDQSIPSLPDLFELCGISDFTVLPEWFHTSTKVTLHSFVATIYERNISLLSVIVGANHRWRLVENFLEFEDISVSLIAYSPFDADSARLELVLRGTIQVGAAELVVTARAPDLLTLARRKSGSYQDNLREEFDRLFSGDNIDKAEVKIDKFIREYGPVIEEADTETNLILFGSLKENIRVVEFLRSIGLPTLDFAEYFKHVMLNDLEIRYDTGSGASHFLVDISDDWPIPLFGNTKLVLSDLFVALSHDGASESLMGGEFGAAISFGGKELTVTAQCSTSDGGWQFEGSIENTDEQGKPEDSAWFHGVLKTQFGIELPSVLREGFSLKKLFVSFNTKSRAFTFSCDCTFKIGETGSEKEIEAILKIDIAPDGKGFREQFGGQVIVTPKRNDSSEKAVEDVKPIYFELGIEHDKEQTSLIAVYRDPEGTKLPIETLFFRVDLTTDLSLWPTAAGNFPGSLRQAFADNDEPVDLSDEARVAVGSGQNHWIVSDGASEYSLRKEGTILNVYRRPVRTKLPLNKLIGEFFHLDESPPTWNIGIRDAFWVHQSVSGEKSQDLFGLDIDGGIDLSQIHLPDLPLVGTGDIFGPEETVRLSFQGIALSENLEKNDKRRQGLVDLLGQYGLKLPDKALNAPFNVDISLQLGSETKQLSAPKIDTKSSEPLKVDGEKLEGNPSVEVMEADDGAQWLNIQKSFGPLHLQRVGIRFEKKGQISGLLDGSFTAAGLTVALEGLTATSSISHPSDVSFDLQGLGINYRNDEVELGGTFLKQTLKYTPQGQQKEQELTAFAGSAVLRAEQLALSAMGVYAKFKNHPSLFIYAVLDYPIGGPSFFFVTGLAAGFGYNRAFQMPPIDEVATFPLITEAKPAKDAGQEKDRDPLTQLNALEKHIPPAIGEDFLAVGIHFTSFKQIDSFALLILQFGMRLEIDLLGLSTMILPPKKAKGKQGSSLAEAKGKQGSSLAEAELAIKASFVPDEGTLRIRGLLTSNSYVLSRENRLTGGFAFFSWFKDSGEANAGDFVATLGGYHPSYHVPAHYPTVPRLALQWKVNDNLTIKGSAYFALSAHAFMVGGCLEAVWQSTNVRAWFTAEADFLIAWQPYYYEASVLVEMGADVTIHVFGTHHLSFEGGAAIDLSGPEFAGHAHVDGKVFGIRVDFDVDFGKSQRPKAIGWDAFKEAFLPDMPCGIAVQSGLLRTIQNDDNSERWIVDPKDAVFTVSSAVPITKHDAPQATTKLAIGPMGLKAESEDAFTSTLEVTITDENNSKKATILHEDADNSDSGLVLKRITKAVPTALWGQPKVVDTQGERYIEPPDLNGESLIKDVVMGFTVNAAKPPEGEHTEELPPKISDPQMCLSDSTWQTAETDDLSWGVPKPDAVSSPSKEQREEMLKALKIPLGKFAAPGDDLAAFYGWKIQS
jgi:hypothetical protein